MERTSSSGQRRRPDAGVDDRLVGRRGAVRGRRQEILHPVAIIIFSVISAALLDTFLTPVLFLRYGGKPRHRLRAIAEAEGAGAAADAPPNARRGSL